MNDHQDSAYNAQFYDEELGEPLPITSVMAWVSAALIVGALACLAMALLVLGAAA